MEKNMQNKHIFIMLYDKRCKNMKKSKPTKSVEQYKILRMISRDDELERNGGRWVAVNRAYRDRKKYRREEGTRLVFFCIFVVWY